MSMSPAPDSSQDGVHDLDDEKLDVVGTSDGRDGASPLHISDGKKKKNIQFVALLSSSSLSRPNAK